MSMTMSASVYDEIGTAEGTEKFPELPEHCKVRVKVLKFEGKRVDAGDSVFVDYEVTEVLHGQVSPGKYSEKFFGLEKVKTGKVKLFNLRRMIAALFKADHSDENQKWGQILRYCVEKDAAVGREMIVETHARKSTEDDKGTYLPKSYNQV